MVNALMKPIASAAESNIYGLNEPAIASGQLEGRGDVECGRQFSEPGVTVINAGGTIRNGRGHGRNGRSEVRNGGATVK